jgi:hypothetical protein
MLETAAPAMSKAAANVGRAREPMSSRKARRWRQEPPCFDGNETVRRLRPFFRRRDSTARPQRVAIRARNPCLLMRRLFRGRYDGFIRGYLQSEPRKLVGGAQWGQVEGEEGRRKGEVFSTLLNVLNFLHVVADLQMTFFYQFFSGPLGLCLRRLFFCQDPIDISIPRP